MILLTFPWSFSPWQEFSSKDISFHLPKFYPFFTSFTPPHQKLLPSCPCSVILAPTLPLTVTSNTLEYVPCSYLFPHTLHMIPLQPLFLHLDSIHIPNLRISPLEWVLPLLRTNHSDRKAENCDNGVSYDEMTIQFTKLLEEMEQCGGVFPKIIWF